MLISTKRAIRTTAETLFEAFINPKHLVEWWGPEGLVNKIDVFEPKVDGQWHMTTRAPDGKTYVNASKFVDITKPSRIVFLHAEPNPAFTMTMSFISESPLSCTVSWHQQFVPNPENEKFRKMIEVANAANLNRLERYLPKVTL